MRRGQVYDARLEPIEGSEQGGNRPVIIVSRDGINANSNLVVAVPCTTYRPERRIYPSQILIPAPDGGLDRDTIALGEQVRAISKSRLLRWRGILSDAVMAQLDKALLITLDLPGQFDEDNDN
ncbi:type II toxin-antitoxin system PemK/MazF family toxin [Iningainema tapete]|uniref:mRNA interferase n=1 Tax=Iningainema tapete BLCC-T55 TaxID=2748662 RepID=A0A8J6XQ82_9CYAN|nr:type II toxin-antitoxin system PemK/MazF family toxin [Iningainema tapete]MBD2776209.1 type II toxin-antitoxin system PemK/MazF family toxin [Iningainema tapete BLCC-T55]